MYMQKNILLGLISLLCTLSGVSYALTSDVSNAALASQTWTSLTTWVTAPKNIEKKDAIGDYINNINFRFCNKWLENELLTTRDMLFINPGEKKELCAAIANNWSKDIKLEYGYSQASSRSDWSVACMGMLAADDFSKMIMISWNNILTIPAHSYVIQRDTLFPPLWYSGIQHGCFVFGIHQENKTSGKSMFSMVSRKAASLDVMVWSDFKVDKAFSLVDQQGGFFTTNKKIKTHFDDNGDLILSLSAQNKGNINQHAIITGRITNALWFQKDFVLEQKKLIAWQTAELTYNVWVIPFYKGLFAVKLNVSYTPTFDFDVSNLPKDILQWGNFDVQGQFFIFSWFRVVLLALILWVITKIFFFRKSSK